MPKNKKVKTATPEEVEELPDAVQADQSGNISIYVFAKPGAQQNKITYITPQAVEIQIAGRAVEGEANTELISYLAKVLGLRKSDMSLIRGMRSRNKTVQIAKGIMALQIVRKMLLLEYMKES